MEKHKYIIIPIEEDLEAQKKLGITPEELENKRFWELGVDSGLINPLKKEKSQKNEGTQSPISN